jgi:hypothetical protein
LHKHPDDYKVEQPCPACHKTAGWRIEQRQYNKRNLCTCGGPECIQINGENFPHRTTHPYCDQHPEGFYNQAKQRGIPDEDIPPEYVPARIKETA